jgi:hypothetical protein
MPAVMLFIALLSMVAGAMLALDWSAYSRAAAGGAGSSIPPWVIFAIAAPVTFQGVFMTYTISHELRHRTHPAARNLFAAATSRVEGAELVSTESGTHFSRQQERKHHKSASVRAR